MTSIVKDVTAPKPLSLRRNFSWTFAGNVVYAGCQWGMLMVLAKLGSPEMLGRFVLGLAITAPIMNFASLGLRAVQATDAKRQYQFRNYLTLRLVSTTLAFLLIAAIAIAGGYRRETVLVILLVGAAKAFEAVSDISYGLLQQRERMDRIARLQMLKGSLSLLAMGATVYISGSVLWGTMALASVWALQLVVFDLPSALWVQGEGGESICPCWDISILARLAWLGLPLALVYVLFALEANIPRYFVEHYLGERDLGIFAAMAYFTVVGRTVTGAIGHTATPRLARYYAEDNISAFRQLLVKMVGIGALLGGLGVLVALLAGREILTVCYTPEYAEYFDVFTWLMVAGAVNYMGSFLGYGMTAARHFRVQMPFGALVTATVAIGCVWLVPTHGMRGGAWAVLMAALVRLVGGVVINANALRRRVQV